MSPDSQPLHVAYRDLLSLSEQMVQRAKAQDSEGLLELENARTAIIASLPDPMPAMSAREVAAIRTTIQEIQACDAIVLEYVEPWKSQISRLLGKRRPTE